MRLPRLSKPIRCQLTCLLVSFFLFVVLDSPFMSDRHKAHDTICMRNMRDVSLALSQYSQDWDYMLPPAKRWADSAAVHIDPVKMPQLYHCPDAHSSHSYVFN